MKYLKIIPAIIIVLLISCNKEKSTCPTEVDLGEVSILQSSKEMFPYNIDEEHVIFKDVNGNEFNFHISKNEVTTPNVLFNSWCKEDENVTPLYSVIQERHTIEMFDESMNKGFQVILFTFFNHNCPDEKQVADFLRLSAFDTEFSTEAWKGNLEIVYNERNYSDLINTRTDYFPQFEINGVSFSDVFVREFSGPLDNRKFYFNNELGIVGFVDMDGETTYNFDRLE